MFCGNCNSMVMPGDKRCRSCGRPVDPKQSGLNRDFRPKAEPTKKESPPVERVIVNNSGAPYLPYTPRPAQLEAIEDIRNALNAGKHMIVESGTGTGKTIISLASTLEVAKPQGRKIVYVTRTISQSDQIMNELRAISKIQNVSGMAITGRNKSCPLAKNNPQYRDASPNVLSLMCEDRRKKSMAGKAGGCRYYDHVKMMVDDVEKFVKEKYPTSEELDRYCESFGCCPYETKKILMKDVDVVAIPYVHLLSKGIRDKLLQNLNIPETPQDMVLIIDEAHNFVDAARDSESFTITDKSVDNALDECTTFKRQPEVWDGVTLSAFLNELKKTMRFVKDQKLGFNEREVLLGNDIEQRLMERFQLSPNELDAVIERIIDIGTARTEAMMENGDNKESELQVIGESLKKWCVSSTERFVRSLKIDKEVTKLSASCIDPKEITGFLNSLNGVVHMSGTLQPLDQYARVLGLGGNPKFMKYPSPFDPSNRKVVYVSDVTTAQKEMQADPTMQNRIERYVVNLCNAVDRNTIVFFTSYNNMRIMRPYIERNLNKHLYWEESGRLNSTMQSLNEFRAGRNGVYFAVMGGSIAEGIDFPGDELCFSIIVGIPYPPPTLESKAMSEMFDKRYGPGKGWTYTSQVPALRKIKQAIGRMIRTETDRGIAVILDNRASRYAKELNATETKDPVGDAVRFFQ